jgi:hypothetical protein
MVLFPAWMMRQVRPYRGNAERISIAFYLFGVSIPSGSACSNAVVYDSSDTTGCAAMDFHPTAMPARFALGEIRLHVCFDRTVQSHLVHA